MSIDLSALEHLIHERRAEMFREAENERLARLARSNPNRRQTSARARLAFALRNLADRLDSGPALATGANNTLAAQIPTWRIEYQACGRSHQT